jgi:hypothetical protein
MGIGPIDDVVARLNLPRVCSGYLYTAGYTAMDCQIYQDFARQARKKNPQVLFTKDLMDTAFRAAVSKVTYLAWRTRRGWYRMQHMNTRVSAYPLEHDNVADLSV